MTLEPNTRLGPYQILSQLGAGGMGEVYRARDERLGRDVAIKILPGSFSTSDDRLARFEQEARAAGVLNHPNVVAVYDIGHHEGAPFVVTELLEGESLRDRLREGPLPARKAIDFAIQTARGMAAAHDKGIVHRDIKPENLFITRDGRLKILDFGLAKVTTEIPMGADSAVATLRAPTNPGVVMGTVGYMSPEQVRGLGVDHRTDIFSFGAVLYEMLAGQRAFHGDSAIEVMNAILKDDPPEITSRDGSIPIGLDRTVRHCLEKQPDSRFQSASDLAFDLEAQSLYSGPMFVSGSARPLRAIRRVLPAVAAVVGALALVVCGVILGRYWLASSAGEPPTYNQLTYRKGAIYSARFAPDGETIIYSASWEGKPSEVYIVRPGNPGTRPLDMPNTYVLAVSRTGEMAISRDEKLSRVAYTGGAPREVLDHVNGADWAPGHDDLAVIRWYDGRFRLEYPIGTVLYQSETVLSLPRFSPDGKHIAFFNHPVSGDDRGSLLVAEVGGTTRVLSDGWSSLGGIAWSPAGDEIWFAGARTGANRSLQAVNLDGQARVISNVAGSLFLHDVTRDGRALVARESARMEVLGRAPGATEDEDLSWLDGSLATDITADGQNLLFSEVNHGGGTNYSVYSRKMDGSPAVRLGEGNGAGLSPDGRWALSITPTTPQKLMVLPTGVGEARVLLEGKGYQFFSARWSPDGQSVLVTGNETDHDMRTYSVPATGGALVPVTPEGVRGNLMSPDGKYVAAIDIHTKKWGLYPTAGGDPLPIAGLQDEEYPLRWSADGRAMLLRTGSMFPVKITRFTLASGRRETVAELKPGDLTGIKPYPKSIVVNPDGTGYAFTYQRVGAELYLLEGCSGWCLDSLGLT